MGSRCQKCGEMKPIEETLGEISHHKGVPWWMEPYCSKCYEEVERERRRATFAEYGKRYRKHLKESGRSPKQLVMAAYGGKCVLCKISDVRCLTIHHTYDDGKDDKPNRRGGGVFYRHLIREGFPQDRGLVILCANCHLIQNGKTCGLLF